MASVQEIRSLVSSYLLGEISAEQFAEQFEPMYRAIRESDGEEIFGLSNQVHARLAHYFDGVVALRMFRFQLNALVPTLPVMQIPVVNVQITLDSANSASQIVPYAASGSISSSLPNKIEQEFQVAGAQPVHLPT